MTKEQRKAQGIANQKQAAANWISTLQRIKDGAYTTREGRRVPIADRTTLRN